MAITYEAACHVHIPSLKCSYQKGTRFVLNENNKVIVGDNEFEANKEFRILVKNNILKALTEEEANSPAQVTAPNVIKAPEREKMRVEMAQDLSRPLVSSNQAEEKRVIETFDEPAERTVRGMSVVTNDGSPIKTTEDKEKAAQAEAVSKARLEALEKARAAAAEKRKASIKADVKADGGE